jgi:predicted glycosyltransferase
MDLLRMNKKALLIPTPGQTEQIHLANHLASKGWFAVTNQKDIDLSRANQLVEAATTPLPDLDVDGFRKALAGLGIQ